MQVEQIIIVVLIVAIYYLINKNKEQKRIINLLHLESEGYLNLLSDVGAMPENLIKNKIDQLNKNLGKVKVKL